MTLLSATAGSSGRWHWRNPQPEGITFSGVAYGNGIFVAVSHSGIILTSSDGAAWIAHEPPINVPLAAVIFAEEQFVAVGGAILRSPNGRDWTAQESPTTNQLNAITFAAGQFVAVGDLGTIATSPDSQHWTMATSTNLDSLTTIAYGNNTFVASGCRTILTSSDGMNWEPHELGVEGCFFGMTFGEGQFVAVGGTARARYDASSVIATSPDGVHWTSQVPNGYGYVYGIVHGDDLFVAVGGFSFFGSQDQTLLVSPDGIHWTTGDSDSYGNRSGNPVLRAVTYAGDSYVAVGALGATVRSNDGFHWESLYGGTRAQLRAVASGNGVAVAVGDLNWEDTDGLARSTILRSTDGLQWVRGESPIEVPLVSVAFGNGNFIAVGETSDNATNHGVVLSSFDGLRWYQNLLLEGWSPSGVVWGDGLFVAAGNDGAVLTSPDGSNWTRQRLPESVDCQAITYANGRFVATSFDNRILCSANGTNWTIEPAPTDRWLARVAGGNGLFVIVAGDQTLVSTNGLDWNVHSVLDIQPRAGWLTGLGYAHSQFFATDSYQLYTSEDGVIWRSEQPLWDLWGVAPSFAAFTEYQNTTIGVGASGAIIQSDPLTDTPPTVVLSSTEHNARIGSSASLIALAQGTPPLHYQWLKNGKPIPDATSLVLTLQPVTPQDAAQYSLAVTNATGTCISSTALLTVSLVSTGPVTLSLARNALSEVSVAAPPGTRCRIESTDALGAPAGWDLRKTFTAGSSAFTWFDARSVNSQQRFYRAAVER